MSTHNIGFRVEIKIICGYPLLYWELFFYLPFKRETIPAEETLLPRFIF